MLPRKSGTAWHGPARPVGHSQVRYRSFRKTQAGPRQRLPLLVGLKPGAPLKLNNFPHSDEDEEWFLKFISATKGAVTSKLAFRFHAYVGASGKCSRWLDTNNVFRSHNLSDAMLNRLTVGTSPTGNLSVTFGGLKSRVAVIGW